MVDMEVKEVTILGEHDCSVFTSIDFFTHATVSIRNLLETILIHLKKRVEELINIHNKMEMEEQNPMKCNLKTNQTT